MKYDGPRYETEAALCVDFAACARRVGWKVYPETGGFDQVFVLPSGDQLGVHAKLRGNCEVLVQAMRLEWETKGPAHRGLLVPRYAASAAFKELARHLRLNVWTAEPERGVCEDWERGHVMRVVESWRVEQEPMWLPPIEDAVPAGVPAPKQLTAWKVAAVKLCARLRGAGFVTSRDFKEVGISTSTWTKFRYGGAWLVAAGKDGKLTRYVPGPGFVPFDTEHPELLAAMAAGDAA